MLFSCWKFDPFSKLRAICVHHVGENEESVPGSEKRDFKYSCCLFIARNLGVGQL
jgi:hypothetical protein